MEYCHRMDLAYAAADLVIGRGGAGAVAELAATGTPAIILPYPYHADQQQRLNAGPLARAGGAIVCDDAVVPAANAAKLREVLLPLMRSPDRLDAMRKAALSVARPDAADTVARWLAEKG
jgi:UDP-N-acetylglucosamine--N-acetylmuramyl-(pentapeptide) pyrophosphoryl-undecaprenol N-acetylglucosamine transferase